MMSSDPYGNAEVARLIGELRTEVRKRRKTATVLVRIGAPAVEPLIAVLRTESWQVRRHAARALGQIGDTRAVKPLISSLLRDRRREVRKAAARSLGQLRDARAAEPLISALRDRVLAVREAAIAALAGMGDSRVVPQLVDALNNRAMWRAYPAAARALMEIARRDPVPELRAALPILQRRARSLWSGTAARQNYQAALRVIEQSTASLKDLPVTAASPPVSREMLPLPAEAPPPASEALPIPADPGMVPAALQRSWWRRLLRTAVRWWRGKW